MTMNPHDTIAARLDEYALGQLSPEERHDVEVHVRECETCSADLRELTLVMEHVARTAGESTPPAALRTRVLDGLALQPQEPPLSAGGGPDARVVALPPARTAERSRPAIGWLAAAAAVVVALGGLLYYSSASRQRLASELRGAEVTVTDLERRLAEYTGQADLAVSILTAGDMRSMALARPDAAGVSTARAYWSPTRGLLVVADQLPAPPPGRIYQVWLIGSGQQPLSA
ncbi:MAG TPA: anti-sigma factor, partial [Vicinamibacterales bacterium]|nr:anti-sigma factor [Vicinamibacterales bacterium]